jgi:hypothetical protein
VILDTALIGASDECNSNTAVSLLGFAKDTTVPAEGAGQLKGGEVFTVKQVVFETRAVPFGLKGHANDRQSVQRRDFVRLNASMSSPFDRAIESRS